MAVTTTGEPANGVNGNGAARNGVSTTGAGTVGTDIETMPHGATCGKFNLRVLWNET
jgi:hypothetical protein